MAHRDIDNTATAPSPIGAWSLREGLGVGVGASIGAVVSVAALTASDGAAGVAIALGAAGEWAWKNAVASPTAPSVDEVDKQIRLAMRVRQAVMTPRAKRTRQISR